jgi:SAM-dependent methyltransferase
MANRVQDGAAAGYLPMNAAHLAFLASDQWAQMLRSDLLPWLTAGGSLGDDVLELGPGPGRTTELLQECAARVTAVELDERLASDLAARLGGSNVEVLHADGTQTGLASDRFSAVTCFHVVHHIPTPDLQDQLFAEAGRVLRPGGVFVLADALDQKEVRQRHLAENETFVPLEPDDLPRRLRRAGLVDCRIDRGGYQLLCRASK